jgi:hypothetical protein
VDAGDELLFGIQFFGEIGKPTLTFKQKEKIVFGELV